MTDWRATTLAELVDEAGGSIRTGPFGSQLHADEYITNSSGVPVVMPKDMVDGQIVDLGMKRIDDSTAERLNIHRCVEGGLLLARRGDIGRLAYVDAEYEGCICGTGSMRIHAPSKEVIHPSFLRYLMQAPLATDWLRQQAVGATMPNLNETIVGAMPLSIPSVLTQRLIAQVLGAFDELIGINKVRIEILERVVRSYFRHQANGLAHLIPGEVVAHGDYPNGLPDGWRSCTLGEVASLNYGKALPKASRHPGDVAVVSSAGVIDTHDTALKSGPGLIIGRKGNVGSVWWVEDAFYPIDTTYYVESDLPLEFLYWALQEAEFVNSHAAVPGLNRDQALAVRVLLPPTNIVAKIALLHRAVFQAVAEYRKVIDAARFARNLLLPRLVTGQLDISDVDLGVLTPAEPE